MENTHQLGVARLRGSARGLSLVEMLVAITIIGILGSVAVINYGDTFRKSKRVICIDFVEQLNNALKEFEQTAWQLEIAADNSVVTEEDQILALLQTKDVTVFGSPHFREDWSPSASSDNQTYRIRWNGATFELMEPGTDGTGYLFDPEGTVFTP